MFLRFIGIGLLLFGVSNLSVQVCSDYAGQTIFRSHTSEVRLTFFSTDTNSRPITELKRNDFAVVDNELVIRNFSSFSSLSATELEVVLLVDCSDSLRSRFGQEVTGVLDVISGSRSVRGDHVSVITFGGMEANILCERECAKRLSPVQLWRNREKGATPLFDALLLGTRIMRAHWTPETRPVFILFSDGIDTISRTSGYEAAQALLASEAPLYVIDMNEPGNEGSALLEQLSEATGGRYFAARGGITAALSAMLEDLNGGYLVTYRLPDQQPGFHRVRIFPTHNSHLQFRCRRGYQVDPSKS